MNPNLPQPSPELLAEAINKYLIPALQKQPIKQPEDKSNKEATP